MRLLTTVDSLTQALLPLKAVSLTDSDMALRKLNTEDDYQSGGSLPWMDAYIRETGDKEAIDPVRMVYPCETGFLLLCHKYKVVVREQTKDYGFLKEALSEWVRENDSPKPMLVCTANAKKRPVLAIDDEIFVNRWLKQENRYVQIIPKGEYSLELNGIENPLLAYKKDQGVLAGGHPRDAGAQNGEKGRRAGKARREV